MAFRDFAHAKAISLAKEIVKMTTHAGSGHPSSAMSLLHVVVTLMHDVMRWDPADPWNLAADRLVLSEGHAVPVIYAAYADLGGVVGKDKASARPLTVADLAGLREADSVLDGHPNPAEGFPFFDAATGSLGQGLSVAAGLVAASRLRKFDRRVYVLVGDGESREGQIWEAMDIVADRDQREVTVIFNCNGQGQADYVSKQQSPEALAAKAAAFGWQSVIIDGHDPDAVRNALTLKREKPLAIIAKTQKGWGCEALKDKSNHGKPVPAKELEAALALIDAMTGKLEIKVADAKSPQITKPIAGKPLPEVALKPTDFHAAMKAAGMDGAVAKNSIATRRAYGAALLAVAQADPRIVALDGDVRNSTFSEVFFAKHPERFVECKIAEQNMISTAVGMAAGGFIPFVSTFAKFVSRAYDQIELAQITRANIKITGSHAGISLGADGPSQMSLHDVAYFRSASQTDDGRGNPVCISLHPSDAVAAYHCTWLMASQPGMCYMRTHRPDVPLLYAPDTRFKIGGSHQLAEGDAVTIVSAGYMVHECKKAVELLASAGIKCSLIDAYCLPLDVEPVFAAAARTKNRILCVEDNYIGGLAGALAEAAARRGDIRVEAMTCRRLPKSTKTTDAIMAYAGLSAKDIADTARKLIA
jgi:transketolase